MCASCDQYGACQEVSRKRKRKRMKREGISEEEGREKRGGEQEGKIKRANEEERKSGRETEVKRKESKRGRRERTRKVG